MTLIEMARSIGLNPKKVANTNGGEFHSSCPRCGGKDRFFIQPSRAQKHCTGYYRCRQCEINGDAIQFARDFLGDSYNEAVERVAGTKPNRETLSLTHIAKDKQFRPNEPKLPTAEWLNTATAFIDASYEHLWQELELLRFLGQRGIKLEVMREYKLGWNPIEQYQENIWETGKRTWLPKGLVIPLMLPGKITGVKIRRADYHAESGGAKYVAIPGGADGFSIYGKTEGRKILAVTESELDAIAIRHAAGDICTTIAIGGNNKTPDLFANALAKRAQHLLIIHDNDQGGLAMLKKWRSIYPHARPYPTPVGKDIGEAIQQGLDLRAWIQAATSLQH